MTTNRELFNKFIIIPILSVILFFNNRPKRLLPICRVPIEAIIICRRLIDRKRSYRSPPHLIPSGLNSIMWTPWQIYVINHNLFTTVKDGNTAHDVLGGRKQNLHFPRNQIIIASCLTGNIGHYRTGILENVKTWHLAVDVK